MIILGLSDGAVPGAALVRDDRLVAVEHAPGPVADRFEPVERVLAAAGVAPGDVDGVALAGRYTPPLPIRRRPRMARFLSDPFGSGRAFGTRYEAILRATGLGAASADRARDWLAEVLAPRGLRPRRIALVDAHRALASAAYRLQPVDRATVLVVHPHGDGVFASVHHAAGGQLDRVVADRGTTGVHLFLERALEQLGARDTWSAGGPSGPGTTCNPAALPALARGIGALPLDDVFAYAGRFRARPGPERRTDEPWAAMARDRADGAASVLRQLRVALGAFLAAHRVDGRVLLAGSVLADPAWLGEALPADLGLGAWRGDHALAVGAAADLAGLVPHAAAVDLGADAGGAEVAPEEVATVLARGDAWIRCAGRVAPGPLAVRGRGIWVRGDDPDQLARLRRVLELPVDARPVRLRRTPPPGLPSALAGTWETGITLGTDTFVGPCGDEVVAARLAALASRGADEVACWPLVRRDRPPAATVAELDDLFAATGAARLEHGVRLVAR